MNLSLAELLSLIGRLDGASGFDTARERFRRFLLEQVTSIDVAEALVDECQERVGEQRHRALQDLTVVIGRFLGFETSFGTYEAAGPAMKIDGRWKARGHLDVVLDVRSDHAADPAADALVRTLAALDASPHEPAYPRIGLIVTSRHFTGRQRLERTLAAQPPAPPLRLVSIQSLLVLARLAATGRVQQGEVLKLLPSSHLLDPVIEILGRTSAGDLQNDPPAMPSTTSAVDRALLPAPATDRLDRRRADFWLVSNLESERQGSDFLFTVIGRRHLLGVGQIGPPQSLGAPGDWVCFFVPRRGIVGHARLASIVEAGAPTLRDAVQYSRIYRLLNVELYGEPVVEAMRADRPFAVPGDAGVSAGPLLTPISQVDFSTFTRGWRRDDDAEMRDETGPRLPAFFSDRRTH